jgi:putative FmdB family regulatory protein
MRPTRCWSSNVPLYEYQCDACGCRFEVIQKFSDPAVETCKECGKGPVHRLLSSPAIQFKGTGWYITDYAQKGKSDSASTPPGSAKSDAAKPDAATDSSSAKSEASKGTTGSSAASAKESKD